MSSGKPVIVTFDGKTEKEYPSATAAAIALNISISTVRKKIHSGEEYVLDGERIKIRFE